MDCNCKVSGYFSATSVVVSEIVYCPLHSSAQAYKDALIKIAAYHDVEASNSFYATGKYSSFDEPASVEIARAALAGGKLEPCLNGSDLKYPR